MSQMISSTDASEKLRNAYLKADVPERDGWFHGPPKVGDRWYRATAYVDEVVDASGIWNDIRTIDQFMDEGVAKKVNVSFSVESRFVQDVTASGNVRLGFYPPEQGDDLYVSFQRVERVPGGLHDGRRHRASGAGRFKPTLAAAMHSLIIRTERRVGHAKREYDRARWIFDETQNIRNLTKEA